MALLRVADYRIAQRPGAGYVLFKLYNPNGSVTDWIGWKYVPPAQLGSLNAILETNHAYYDDRLEIFSTGSASNRLIGHFVKKLTLNPVGITTSLTKEKASAETKKQLPAKKKAIKKKRS